MLIYGHGDTVEASRYMNTLRTVAGDGFAVVAYKSCVHVVQGDPTTECDMGHGSFLEALKIIDFFTCRPSASSLVPADMSAKVTVAGHSGGGRTSLMVAAVRDSPSYLSGTKFAKTLDARDGALRRAAAKVGAAIALHADSMADPNSNPDIDGFYHAIRETPVLVETSADDSIVPARDAWRNFLAVRSPVKLYLNLEQGQGGHLQPMTRGKESRWMALFAQYALGDFSAERLLFDDCQDCLRRGMSYTADKTCEDGNIGILLCGGAENRTWPAKYASFCHPALL